MRVWCVFVLILLTGFVSAQTSGNTCSSPDDVILRLSAPSNAHAEIFSATGIYTTDVCYSQIFGTAYTGVNPHACNTGITNRVLRLSAPSNAHAEIPDQSVPIYTTDVCYGNLVCHSVTGNTNCASGEQEIVSLSGQTNAHIEKADANVYTTLSNYKICCSTSSSSPPVGPGTPNNPPTGPGNIVSVGWAHLDGQPISTGTLFCPNSAVYSYAITSGVPDGTTLTFKFYDKDILVNDFIFEIGVAVQNNIASFPVNFADTNVQNILQPYIDGNDNDVELMFKAEIGTNNQDSNVIIYRNLCNYVPPVVTNPITRCEDFANQNSCNSNTISTYPQNSYGVQQLPVCTFLQCYWISDTAGCGVRATQYPSTPQSGCNSAGNAINNCAWTTTQSECINGVKTISYVGDLTNTPNCIKESITVACGSLNFELGFFGIAQFISSILIIGLFYLIFEINKNVKK